MKTFTDMNGKKGKIGDTVQIFDPYEKVLSDVRATVLGGWRQGADGTILKLNKAPLPDYPSHYTHRASEVVIV